MTATPGLSIHSVPPLEDGGVVARTGFTFQDHVAAGLCLEMLQNTSLEEVWCETQDDITLIWSCPTDQRVEFVQVKSNEPDQLWTLAKLCERPAGSGASIIEKSLRYDRITQERCSFRVVTARPVTGELEVLTLPMTSPSRDQKNGIFQSLCKSVRTRIGDFASPNGNGCDFWLSNALWIVEHGTVQVRDKNLLALRRIIEQGRGYLTTDQTEEVYSKVLRKVIDAAEGKWSVDPNTKKIKSHAFRDWFWRTVNGVQYPVSANGGQNMEAKMGPAQANLPQDYIEAAHEARRQYREEILNNRYLSIDDLRLVEGEVAAILMQLRSRLDCGALPDQGLRFHALCLTALAELRDRLRVSPPVPLGFLHGCMYNITDRCTHRFRRVTA